MSHFKKQKTKEFGRKSLPDIEEEPNSTQSNKEPLMLIDDDMFLDVEKFNQDEEFKINRKTINTEGSEFEEKEPNFDDFEFHGTKEKTNRTSILIKNKPRDEEDILRMESPFYKVDSKNTAILKKAYTKKMEVSYMSDKNDKSVNHKSVALNRTETKYKDLNSMIDFKMVNKLEIRTFESLFMTVLQIINCIIRYTIIQIPYCMKVLGLVYGPLAISIIGLMSVFSVYMLIKVKEATGER